MRQDAWLKKTMLLLPFCCGSIMLYAQVQENNTDRFSKASKKIERAFEKNNTDTLASGYFDLGGTYYQRGDLAKSETYYQKAKQQYEKMADADGIAKSSRALAKVQEELHKDKDALSNYYSAKENNMKVGDVSGNTLNGNDISRLKQPDSFAVQQQYLQDNINLGILNKDTNEIVGGYSKQADISLKNRQTNTAVAAFGNAYRFSKNNPEQAVRFNQAITDAYVQDRDFTKAIETKKGLLNESFVQSSTQLQASQITSLADIYIKKEEDSTAIRLLNESYTLSVKNGHVLEAKESLVRLDSIYQSQGKQTKSLGLYKNFVLELDSIISKDSSLVDSKIIGETEAKIKKLESEKAIKDELIREKILLNYWLIGSIVALAIFVGIILFVVKKLKIKNKKIALQSLRREMNPHFIFNSLNSINQFIANNNEMEANQYLAKFSTLMRRVMENSKEDFVLISKELELLKNYLDLERSRFPDKFDFSIKVDDALYADEQLYIPGMLIQPYLENAIWHGLRYMDEKGFLQVSFKTDQQKVEIIIEDNGIGIAESKKNKTQHQKSQGGRGISNTMERIKILNELYRQNITCVVEDKASPDNGVKISLTVPLLKNIKHED